MAANEKILPRPRRKRRHRWAFPFGLAIISLALVGTITLASFGVNEIKKLTDRTALKSEYEHFLLPVVEIDPDPFDDLTKANMSQLIDSSILKLLKTRADSVKPPEDYNEVELDGGITGMEIPRDDVDYYFEYLFGKELIPDHTAFNDSSFGFSYNSATKNYVVPMSGEAGIYIPKVYNINKKGDSIILTVGYFQNDNLDNSSVNNFDISEAEKVMKITLRVTERTPGYYVSALQDTTPEDIAGLVASQKTTNPVTTAEPTTVIESTKEETTKPVQNSTRNITTAAKNTTLSSTTAKSAAVKSTTVKTTSKKTTITKKATTQTTTVKSSVTVRTAVHNGNRVR